MIESKNNKTSINLDTGGLRLNNAIINRPMNQRISWNPKEYEAVKIDLDQGNVVLKKIENAE